METERDERFEKSLLEVVLHYVSVLVRYRWLIIIVTVGVTAVAVGFALLSRLLPPDKSPLPNIYAAQASILVQQNDQNDLAASLLEGIGFDQRANPTASYRNSDLILEILNSRMLLDRVIEEFNMVERYRITGNVKGQSRELLRHKAVFDYSRGSGVLKISFEDIDPELSRDVVNRMVVLLEEWFNRNSGLAAQRQRRMLEEKIAEVRSEISLLQDRLRVLQERYGVLSVDDLGRSQATLLATLRAQLILKEIDVKNYSSISRIDDPRLEQLKNERQNLIDLINQNQRSVLVSPQTINDGKSLPEVAQEFSQLRLQLDIQQRIYNSLAPQYEAAKLSPGSIFQVLEMAEVPDTKSGPQRARIVLLAALAGFAGSLVLAILVNAMRQIDGDRTNHNRLTRTVREAATKRTAHEPIRRNG